MLSQGKQDTHQDGQKHSAQGWSLWTIRGFTFLRIERRHWLNNYSIFFSYGYLRKTLRISWAQSRGWLQSFSCHFCHSLLMSGESSGPSCHCLLDMLAVFTPSPSFHHVLSHLSLFLHTSHLLAPTLALMGDGRLIFSFNFLFCLMEKLTAYQQL